MIAYHNDQKIKAELKFIKSCVGDNPLKKELTQIELRDGLITCADGFQALRFELPLHKSKYNNNVQAYSAKSLLIKNIKKGGLHDVFQKAKPLNTQFSIPNLDCIFNLKYESLTKIDAVLADEMLGSLEIYNTRSLKNLKVKLLYSKTRGFLIVRDGIDKVEKEEIMFACSAYNLLNLLTLISKTKGEVKLFFNGELSPLLFRSAPSSVDHLRGSPPPTFDYILMPVKL